MASVQHSIEVDVPVSTAYNQWTQFETFPEFMKGVESVEQIDVELEWEPEELVEKTGSAVGADSSQVTADLGRFKEFIESRGIETGEWRSSVAQGEVDDAGSDNELPR